MANDSHGHGDMTDDEEEVWVLPITEAEAEALLEGEEVVFGYDGAVIEQDPTFVIEVDDD